MGLGVQNGGGEFEQRPRLPFIVLEEVLLMDRTAILLTLCLASAAVLAGCTAQAMPSGTAMATQPPADEAASQWAADAQLVGILGVEGAWSGSSFGGYSDHGQGDFYSYSGNDHKIDGRCEIWAYLYLSESKNMVLTVAVDAEGNVVDKEEEAADDEVPVGAYSVNSDEAIRIALDASEQLAASQDHENHHAMLALGRDDTDEPALWMVTGGGYDDGDYVGAMVLIDATDGSVLMAQDFGGDAWGSYGDAYSGYGGYGGYGGLADQAFTLVA